MGRHEHSNHQQFFSFFKCTLELKIIFKSKICIITIFKEDTYYFAKENTKDTGPSLGDTRIGLSHKNSIKF